MSETTSVDQQITQDHPGVLALRRRAERLSFGLMSFPRMHKLCICGLWESS